MKLTAEIDGQSYALDWRREGARVEASVDGRRYELEARETEAGSFCCSPVGASMSAERIARMLRVARAKCTSAMRYFK
ncbi:MAG: hypothetical protein LC747_06425 [Acidobacteria bacterium]|nr:hypothetical protein [Acidobacteriota bacterium]